MTRSLRAVSRIALVCGVVAAGVGSGVARAQTAAVSARNIRLCHGDAPPCEVVSQWEGVGDEHVVTALVTDAGGAPVADVPVEFREEGYGRFTIGDDERVVSTGADGRAAAVLVAEEPGQSYVWAEISPVGTPGGFRGPAADDDECEQPSHPDGSPGAGNCLSGPLIVDWEEPPPPPQCSDGIDNNGDGTVDMEDPSCSGDFDPTEGTTDHFDVRANRKLTLSFSDWTRDRLVVFGRVRAPAGPPECVEGVAVRVLSRKGGPWVPLATVTTSRAGWYVVVVPDRPGRYRATALRHETFTPAGEFAICRKALHAKPHRHDT